MKTENKMRLALLCSFCLSVTLPACSLDGDDQLFFTYPNYSPERRYVPRGDSLRPFSGLSGDAVIMTAVRFAPKYDYVRDTAMGLAEAELLLLENYRPALTIPTGPQARVSTDPYTHHIVGGHLFTEFTNSDGTAIGMDGRIIIGYPQKEKLAGILIDSLSHIWTIGEDGDGFTLRKDGSIVLQRASAKVFGGFEDLSCPPSGALSLSDGHVEMFFSTFVYDQQDYYVVQDGLCHCIRPPSSASKVFDIKNTVSGPCFMYEDSGGEVYVARDSLDRTKLPVKRRESVESGTLIPYLDGCDAAMATVRRSDGSTCEVFWKCGNEMGRWEKREDEMVLWCGSSPVRIVIPDGFYLSGPRCVSTADGVVNLALTSKRLSFAAIGDGDGHHLLNIYGYLTSLQMPPLSSLPTREVSTRHPERSGEP